MKPHPINYKIKTDGFVIGVCELEPMTKAERDVVKRQIAKEYGLRPENVYLEEVVPCRT